MRPVYTTKPIGDVQSLAAALGMSKSTLLDLANIAETQYTHFTIPKASGKPRYVSSPHHDLKIVQKRINRSVFGNVNYPDYLYGGIEDRDYVRNARAHAGSGALGHRSLRRCELSQ